ncbi:MAG: 23S rRNA (adenine(2503)-C(2))-methyltransferase RlmN, partial [Solirubrobacterales bacterium]
MNKDLKDMTFEELERTLVGLGQKKYLAGYLFKFIHAQNGRDLSALTTLSKAFRAQLVEQGYFISQIKTVDCLRDADGSAKYLFELADGERIESVLLPDEDRLTLCVSTQVGCPMGCAFCATGKIQFRRNLTAGEIVDQVYAAEASLVAVEAASSNQQSTIKNQPSEALPRITNLVYMGMGEPFQNYDAVLRSIRILNHSSG